MTIREQIKMLVEQFDQNLSFYKSTAYNETEVRIEFLNPFFELLGWDVQNEKGLPVFSREVRHEASVFVEEDEELKGKKPDYLFQLGPKKCFYLEAKKPSVNLIDGKSPAFQTRRYGWSGNLGISVLSNFEYLSIYDCTVRPLETDSPNVALLARYHYTQYLEKFDEIAKWLSRKSVVDGVFDFQLSCLEDLHGRQSFDDYFLDQIRAWRLEISQDFANRHLFKNDEDLNSYVQKILNRILFLRICEDKEYERYEELKKVESSEDLLKIFRSADAKYDSGLFDMVTADEPIPSTDVLLNVLKDLYYPNSSYDFNVVDTFVMSQIYDLFLCEEAHIIDGDVVMIIKPDLADAEGAVCTPSSVASTIVKEALDAILEDSPNRPVLDIRAADICCGSGIFLRSAFERLCAKRVEELKVELEQSLRDGKLLQIEDDCVLGFEEKRILLLSCIFGVDIDSAAVEICRFNLLIKLLEDVSSEEVLDFKNRTGKKILPNLESNIKVGNSLVGEEYYAFNPAALTDLDLLKKVKPFNWDTEFYDKFDVIVGNPPYIRVQNLVQHSPEEYAFIKGEESGYQTASEGLPDKYQLFIERALSLLEADGYLSYIVPNKFMTLQGGTTLRSMLSEGGYVRKIINFGSEQIFPNRMTYTCILLLSRMPKSTFEFASIDDSRTYFLDGCNCVEYASITLGRSPWAIPDPEADKVVSSLGNKIAPLKDLAKAFVGLQTSADNIYIINPNEEVDELVKFVDLDGIERVIEKEILRPCIYDAILTKYEPVKPNRLMIFPYKIVDGRARIIDGETLKMQYPYAYEYLDAHRGRLMKRSCNTMTEDTWYPFGRSQSLTKFGPDVQHIVWSTLSLSAKYTIDDSSTCFTGGGNGPYYGLLMNEDTPESIYYILALLNHPFLESFIRRTSSYFNGGYYSHGKQFVETLPIRRIAFDDPGEILIHDKIVGYVKELIDLSEERAKSITHEQQVLIDRAINVVEENLNGLIGELYGFERVI